MSKELKQKILLICFWIVRIIYLTFFFVTIPVTVILAALDSLQGKIDDAAHADEPTKINYP